MATAALTVVPDGATGVVTRIVNAFLESFEMVMEVEISETHSRGPGFARRRGSGVGLRPTSGVGGRAAPDVGSRGPGFARRRG